MDTLSKDVIGTKVGPRTFEYTWRDVVLYALSVGAKEDEVEYLYEKDLRAVPSFGAVPYWGTFGISPIITVPHPAIISLALKPEGGLHMAQELIIHKAIPALGGKLTFSDVVTDVYDRGGGKGVVVRTELIAYDEQGEKVFTNIGDNFNRLYTALDADAPPKNEVVLPDREPNFVETDYIPGHQAFIYRLTGDTNIFHVDSGEAAKAGFKKPIIQGLCTFGYGCRMAVKAMIPKEPERVTRYAAQLRTPLFPGSQVELQAWKVTEHKAYFNLIDLSTNKPTLDKGIIEWS